MPSLESLHSQFKGNEFILLAVDVGEKRSAVQEFISRKGYSFLNVLDEDGAVSALYGVRSHPMKFLINKDGELMGIASGYREWDTDEMKQLIRRLINFRG